MEFLAVFLLLGLILQTGTCQENSEGFGEDRTRPTMDEEMDPSIKEDPTQPSMDQKVDPDTEEAADLEVNTGMNEDLTRPSADQAMDPEFDPRYMRSRKISMKAPELTAEEEGSRHMPRAYRCDGCRGVAHQLQQRFSMAEKKMKKLHHWDILEIVEDVCENSLSNYGLKNVDGMKVLSGEGLKYDKEMGLMQTGGKWVGRMVTLCGELVEMYEEEGIYDQYLVRGESKLEASLCRNHCGKQELDEPVVDNRDEL